ncbi:MAG TPA: serine/threonine-protein kinase, partial [Patescibacteria group bacterium]|nr:serine/threonine-protein kinase [Patescibacteria group bacterium]
ASRLQTLLNADVAALRLWFSERQSDARFCASDLPVQETITQLAELARTTNATDDSLANSEASKKLADHLKPILDAHQYLDYMVLAPDRRILASAYPRLVGRLAPRTYEVFMWRSLRGELAVSRPFAREATLSQRAEGPLMFVSAPVKSSTGAVVAILALRMRPEEEFTRIFSVARMGETGEAYAFDHRAIMLTASRFDQELKNRGLIPNAPEATAILNMRLVEPATGSEAAARRPGSHEPRLTRMAASALMGEEGYDVVGYKNYRGEKVVGAWTWLPEYGMGVATEVSTTEAFQTLYLLRQAFIVLFLLLVLSGLGIFAFTLWVETLQASIRNDALVLRRLGQYVLLQEIGRGANGMVYRARHSLLRRPVAIKLLSPDLTNEDTAARFEHEVQMTSQLTHPNTVSIYDYGRTPEGLFYYAMEFLSGINLDQLTRKFGPQPEGRVIHILRQVCGSLAEAHRIGLIHRDIKPANILLTRRGGLCDVVKVLDFGLVKARNLLPPDKTTANAVVGTPHFIAPEAVNQPQAVDGRSDLYSVGAVGYWLLTGRTLFESANVQELLDGHVKALPKSPSTWLSRPLNPDLEGIIMKCLSKSPDQRPRTAEDLDHALSQCAAAGSWTTEQAEQWWTSCVSLLESPPITPVAEKTLVIGRRS